MTDDAPRTLFGANGKKIEIRPGSAWPLPFRGSRYSVKQVGKYIRAVWEWQDLQVVSDNYPARVHKLLISAGKPRGSVCVTAHGDIITKIPTKSGNWTPVYLGRYEDDFVFSHVENNPKNLKTGMLWTGFPFHHGDIWTISPRETGGQLMWKYLSTYLGSIQRYPNLIKKYKSIRFTGGRLHFTEHGHVWMNLPDSDVSDGFVDEFHELQARQLEDLASGGRGVILQLVAARLQATDCRPVYLGRVAEFENAESPWTYFTTLSARGFGAGGEAAVDGGDLDEDH